LRLDALTAAGARKVLEVGIAKAQAMGVPQFALAAIAALPGARSEM